MSRFSTTTLAVLVAAVALASGCPYRTGPEESVAGFAEAVDDGDANTAWALLAPEARGGTRWDRFEGRVRRIAATRDAVRPEGESPRTERLEASWGPSSPVVSWRDGGWLIEEGLLDLYPRDTPVSALRSFVSAYRKGRFDVVLEMAPADVRSRQSLADLRRRAESGEMEALLGPRVEELERFLRSGEFTAVSPGLMEDERVRIPYGPFVAVLVREADGWRIEDL